MVKTKKRGGEMPGCKRDQRILGDKEKVGEVKEREIGDSGIQDLNREKPSGERCILKMVERSVLKVTW